MRWPWQPASDAPQEDPDARPEEARQARIEAEADLQTARDQWHGVMALAGALRHLREANHFAEKVAETMRRRTDV